MSIATMSPGVATGTVAPDELAKVGAALADATRVKMLRLMQLNEEVACAALETIFALTKSTISYHVRVLRDAGLIRVRKDGKFYYYALMRREIEERLPGVLNLLAATSMPFVSTVPGPRGMQALSLDRTFR
jgi:DNA-binding transcriptional ArsR family regulator